MKLGPFTFVGEVTDAHLADTRMLLDVDFPWHTLIGTVISIRTGNWPVTSHAGTTVHMPPDFYNWRSTLAHELGHVFDLRRLSLAGRVAIHDAMHSGVSNTPSHLVLHRDEVFDHYHAWGLKGTAGHSVAPSEAFADWFRWRLGVHPTTFYGLHSWSEDNQQQTIGGVVMAAANVQIFPDVPLDHTHAAGIHWAVGQGLVSGFSDGTFRPQEFVTRAQFCTVLSAYHASTEA